MMETSAKLQLFAGLWHGRTTTSLRLKEFSMTWAVLPICPFLFFYLFRSQALQRQTFHEKLLNDTWAV